MPYVVLGSGFTQEGNVEHKIFFLIRREITRVNITSLKKKRKKKGFFFLNVYVSFIKIIQEMNLLLFCGKTIWELLFFLF